MPDAVFVGGLPWGLVLPMEGLVLLRQGIVVLQEIQGGLQVGAASPAQGGEDADGCLAGGDVGLPDFVLRVAFGKLRTACPKASQLVDDVVDGHGFAHGSFLRSIASGLAHPKATRHILAPRTWWS